MSVDVDQVVLLAKLSLLSSLPLLIWLVAFLLWRRKLLMKSKPQIAKRVHIAYPGASYVGGERYFVPHCGFAHALLYRVDLARPRWSLGKKVKYVKALTRLLRYNTYDNEGASSQEYLTVRMEVAGEICVFKTHVFVCVDKLHDRYLVSNTNYRKIRYLCCYMGLDNEVESLFAHGWIDYTTWMERLRWAKDGFTPGI